MNTVEDGTRAANEVARCVNDIQQLMATGVKASDPRIIELRERRDRARDVWKNSPAPGRAPNGAIEGLMDGAGERETTALDRHTSTPEYRAALNRLAKACAGNGGFAALTEVERNTLTAASDGQGGYTVPADSRAQIIARMPALSEIVGLMTPWPTSRDMCEVPRATPNADAGTALTKGEHIYTSAFVASMVGEQPSTTAGQNEPSFGMFAIPVKNGRSQARLSFNLVADAEFDILEFLKGDGAKNGALLREGQVVSGTGIGPNCKGLLQYAGDGTGDSIATVDIGGTTTHTISNTTTDLGSAKKILDLIYAVPAQYRNDPSFRIVMNSGSFRKVKGLVDADNRPVLAQGGDGMLGTTLRTIDGYKVAISEFMPDGAAATDTPILCGAFSEAILAVRQELSVAVYQERFADLDEVAVFLRQRFGVGVANNDAFRFGICTA